MTRGWGDIVVEMAKLWIPDTPKITNLYFVMLRAILVIHQRPFVWYVL